MTKQTETEKEIKTPSPHLTIQVGGKPTQLFMSAGMLHELVIISEQLEDISGIYLDPTVQGKCLVHLLVERDARGVPVEDPTELTLMQFPMSTEDSDKVAKWVGDHLLAFFIKGAGNMQKAVAEQQETFKSLEQLSTGLNNLTE